MTACRSAAVSERPFDIACQAILDPIAVFDARVRANRARVDRIKDIAIPRPRLRR